MLFKWLHQIVYNIIVDISSSKWNADTIFARCYELLRGPLVSAYKKPGTPWLLHENELRSVNKRLLIFSTYIPAGSWRRSCHLHLHSCISLLGGWWINQVDYDWLSFIMIDWGWLRLIKFDYDWFRLIMIKNHLWLILGLIASLAFLGPRMACGGDGVESRSPPTSSAPPHAPPDVSPDMQRCGLNQHRWNCRLVRFVWKCRDNLSVGRMDLWI